jgi:hypothetical protein
LTITDELTIDFQSQVAFVNGYPVSASITGTFWKLAPGANTIRLYAEYDPDADFTIIAASAWE